MNSNPPQRGGQPCRIPAIVRAPHSRLTPRGAPLKRKTGSGAAPPPLERRGFCERRGLCPEKNATASSVFSATVAATTAAIAATG